MGSRQPLIIQVMMERGRVKEEGKEMRPISPREATTASSHQTHKGHNEELLGCGLMVAQAPPTSPKVYPDRCSRDCPSHRQAYERRRSIRAIKEPCVAGLYVPI